jgi:hypothetical protein
MIAQGEGSAADYAADDCEEDAKQQQDAAEAIAFLAVMAMPSACSATGQSVMAGWRALFGSDAAFKLGGSGWLRRCPPQVR